MKRTLLALGGLTLIAAALVLTARDRATDEAPTPAQTPAAARAPEPPAAPQLAQRRGDQVTAIQAQAEQAARAGDRLADPTQSFAARRQAADALAHAQTPAAQVALRTGLQAVVDDPQLPSAARALLVQRLGFVREPDADSLAFARGLTQAEDVDLRRAGLMTYAAVAGHAGHEAEAISVIDPALADPDPETRAVGYRALGNLKSPEAFARLQQAAGAEESKVARAGLAQGLAGDPSAPSTAALARLARTQHAPTQLRALVGLSGRALSAEAAADLARAGGPDALFAENASAWVSAAAPHFAERGLRRAAEGLTRRSEVGPKVRARVRQLLNL